jgi:hypothetical protein
MPKKAIHYCQSFVSKRKESHQINQGLDTSLNHPDNEDRRTFASILVREAVLGLIPLGALIYSKQFVGVDSAYPTLWMMGGISIVALQRYVWQTLRSVRANIFIAIKYPKIKRNASKISFDNLPQNLMVIPTYEEDRVVTTKVFSAIAKQARELSKPIVIGVSAKDQVSFEKVNKNLDHDEKINEHAFIERVVKQVEPLTISIEIDPDRPNTNEREYIQHIITIANTKNIKKRDQLLQQFDASSYGQRLRKELDIFSLAPLFLPKIILLRLYQDFQPKADEFWKGQKKRYAIGIALRAMQHIDFPNNSVLWLMDGDSQLTSGVLRKCSSIMESTQCHAITTNEKVSFVDRHKTGLGGKILSRWFSLHMAKRHVQMAAQAYGKKLSVLTGRFSGVRWEIAKIPAFSQMVQTDACWSVIWGKIPLLSGDDKSTWFAIFKYLKITNQLPVRMLYVPDATVISLENVIPQGPLFHAITNMQRWFGNTYRNLWRAINLGNKTTGAYLRFEFLDQLINPFTGALVPMLAFLSLKDYILYDHPLRYFTSLVAWVIWATIIQMTTIYRHSFDILKKNPLTVLLDVPLIVTSRWGAAYIKLVTLPALGMQKWVRHRQATNAASSKHEMFTKTSIMQASRIILLSFIFLAAQITRGKIDPKEVFQFVANPNMSTIATLKKEKPKILHLDRTWSARQINDEIQSFIPNKSYSELIFIIHGTIELEESISIDRSNISIIGDSKHNSKLLITDVQPLLLVESAKSIVLSDLTLATDNSENERRARIETYNSAIVANGVRLKGILSLNGKSEFKHIFSEIGSVYVNDQGQMIDILEKTDIVQNKAAL